MSSVIRARDCSLMDTVSDVLQGKRITQEDKSRSKYSKIRKSEHEDQECLEWRHHLCAWDARIKLSIVIASLRVRQSLLQEIFLCNSFVMLVPSVAVCCFLVGFLGSFPVQDYVFGRHQGGEMFPSSSLGSENEHNPGSSQCWAPQRRKGCRKLYLW